VINELAELVEQRYLDLEVGAELGRTLTASLAAGRYPSDPAQLAELVTADLQSINGDKHLRLVHHEEPIEPRDHGDDAAELEEMAAWAARTGNSVASVQQLAGNVGYVDLQPVLFPVSLCGEVITAAMTLVATCDALILDLRGCLGGDPAMVAFICSYLYGPDPVELTGQFEVGRLTQSWTSPYVPGHRFGPDKPVYVLTSSTTFSGGEQLAYDLQQSGRATVVGATTGGGAHAREGFVLDPHLEATISVARSVNPVTNSNWEGTGVVPDIDVAADEARDHALRLASARG
jgi:hypothetical protein